MRTKAMGLGIPHLLPSLIAQTEALQEGRWLGILRGLVLCSSILYGPGLYPCILLQPDPCSGLLPAPDLCPRILHAPDVSALLHGPDPFSVILRNLCFGILYGLYDLCLRIFLIRPGLELLQQDFSWWLTDFGLTLIGSDFVARRRVPCSRLQGLSDGGG